MLCFLRQLDEDTRNIYKENIDLVESLRIYKQELEHLQQSKDQSIKQYATMVDDRTLNGSLVREKIELVQKQTHTIQQVTVDETKTFSSSSARCSS